MEELERVGKAFDLHVANPLAGGVSPTLRPEEYFRLGLEILPYGIDLILRVSPRDAGRAGGRALGAVRVDAPQGDYAPPADNRIRSR